MEVWPADDVEGLMPLKDNFHYLDSQWEEGRPCYATRGFRELRDGGRFRPEPFLGLPTKRGTA